ncbi:hypothetical protein D9M71_178760 [compost metagenome]
MTGDHQLDAAIKIGRHVGDVMHQQHRPAVELQVQTVGQLPRPGCVQVIVAPHRIHRRDCGQLFEDRLVTDVTRVKDAITALQGGNGFGAEQTVGVGDDADFHRGRLEMHAGSRFKRMSPARSIVERSVQFNHIAADPGR